MVANNLVICSWNANNVKGKISQVTEFLFRYKIDVFLVNETKLKGEETIKISGYNSMTKNRDNGAGGVAIIIKEGIPYERIDIKRQISLEYICVRLRSNLHIVGVYNRPLNHFTDGDLDSLLQVAQKVLVVGDMNARHANRNCHRNNMNGITLNKYVQNNNIAALYTDTPTHIPFNSGTPTTIDNNKQTSHKYNTPKYTK